MNESPDVEFKEQIVSFVKDHMT